MIDYDTVEDILDEIMEDPEMRNASECGSSLQGHADMHLPPPPPPNRILPP